MAWMKKNLCIPEEILELYAIDGVREASRFREIETHLAICPECRAVHTTWKTFYQDAFSIPQNVVETISKRILQHSKFSQKNLTLELYPMSQPKTLNGKYRLAAAGGYLARYETVQHYANAEQDVVARILQDNDSKELTLYLIQEADRGFDELVLEIEGIEEYYIPDSEGRIQLVDLNAAQLDQQKLILRSPLTSFTLEPLSGLKEHISLEGSFEIPGGDFDQIRIEVDQESSKTYYKVNILRLKNCPDAQNVHVEVAQQGESRKLSRAHQGIAVFESFDLEKTLTIRIY